SSDLIVNTETRADLANGDLASIGSDAAHDPLCQFCKRQDLVCEAGPGYRTRQAPDRAGSFVLDQDPTTAFADVLAAAQSIFAHPSHYHSQNLGTKSPSRGPQQHIGRRTASILCHVLI